MAQRKRVRVDVDPVLWAKLKLRAEVNHRTVSDELHDILELDDRHERMHERLRAEKEQAGG